MPARFSCRISKEKKTSTLRSSVLLVFGQAVRRTINYQWWGWNKVERVPIAIVSRSLSFRFDFFSKCNTQFRNTNFGFLETLISYHNQRRFLRNSRRMSVEKKTQARNTSHSSDRMGFFQKLFFRSIHSIHLSL